MKTLTTLSPSMNISRHLYTFHLRQALNMVPIAPTIGRPKCRLLPKLFSALCSIMMQLNFIPRYRNSHITVVYQHISLLTHRLSLIFRFVHMRTPRLVEEGRPHDRFDRSIVFPPSRRRRIFEVHDVWREALAHGTGSFELTANLFLVLQLLECSRLPRGSGGGCAGCASQGFRLRLWRLSICAMGHRAVHIRYKCAPASLVAEGLWSGIVILEWESRSWDSIVFEVGKR